jgi:uncharacterized membrane protein
MLNTYLRLILIVAAVLVAVWVLTVGVVLLVKAAVIAAIVLGVLFLINLFRRRSGQAPLSR